MKLTRFLTISFLLSLILFSCNKEGRNGIVQEGDNNVLISKLGYKFSEDPLTKSGNKEKTIGVATVDIDDNYILVAELINAGNIELQETKATENQAVTDLTVVTFYDQEAKGAPRIQKDITTEFEIPGEGKCTALFLGNVSNEFTLQDGTNGTSGSVTRDGGKANSVNSGANLCWYSMEFSNPISDGDKIELNSMIPLFAQIGDIIVPTTTSDNWTIDKISNIKITSGNQANSGDITISSTNVSYTKTNINSDALITSNASVGTNSLKINFIPNNNNCSISADFYLTGKTNYKNLTFNFKKSLEQGKRYNITFKLIRNGIRFKFYVNTQQRGIYNEDFDKKMQIFIRNNNSDKLTEAGKTGDFAYFKYGSTIKLPTTAEREATTEFDPTKFMTFDGRWYTSNICKPGQHYTASGNGVTVNTQYFSALKDSDVIELYAFFEPKFYYWDSDRSIKEGGTSKLGQTLSSNQATTTIFSSLPSIEDYGRYLQNTYYFDDGYTNDKQTGVWFKKWTSGTNTITPFDRNNTTVYAQTQINKISNGQFPSGVNKDDYFFVPNLGIYDSNNENCPAAIESSTMGSNGVGYWPSDLPNSSYLQHTTVATDGPITQGIMFDDTYMVKYGISNGGVHIDGTLIATNGFLAIWPDKTYTK